MVQGNRKKGLKAWLKHHTIVVVMVCLSIITLGGVTAIGLIFSSANQAMVEEARENNEQARQMVSLETRRGEFITKWRPVLESRGCNPEDVSIIAGAVYDELTIQRCMRTDTSEWITPTLVFALIELESEYDPDAFNPDANDSGLMQIIPSTWWLIERSLHMYDENPFDVRTNIKFGIYWLRMLEGCSFSKVHMLGTYNAGRYWNGEQGRKYASIIVQKEAQLKSTLDTYYEESDVQLLEAISP